MSNVNGNDIDDLFKRAADGYPLRTNSSDWERLASDLDRDPSLILPPLSTEPDTRRRRRFLWLLLLLPLGGLGYLALRPGKPAKTITVAAGVPSESTDDGSTKNVKSALPPASSKTSRDGTSYITASGSEQKAAKDAEGIGGTAGKERHKQELQQVQKGNQVQNGNHVKGTNGDVEGTVAENGGTYSDGAPTGRTVKDRIRKDGKDGGPAAAKPVRGGTATSGTGSGGKRTGKALTRGSATGTEAVISDEDANRGNETPINIAATGGSNSSRTLPRDPKTSPVLTARAVPGKDYSVDIPVKAAAAQGPVKQQAAKTPRTLAKKKPFFYAGLTAAPDISTVRMQSVKGTGTTFGLILGYNFGSRWSIETGLNLDRKKYYTAGEYYDKKNYTYLNYIDNLKVDGVCNMWELPVNARYNFGKGQQLKWFATAGLSSYFMTRQRYVFAGDYNGNPWGPHAYTISGKSNYLFSIVNLSIGYEQKIGRIGNLRLEPYVKIPLAGVGSGSLPIMSAGLNIGITRRIW